MGVQTDVLIADLSDAQAIADSVNPTANWEGFSFGGFHHVQLCTLLSLLQSGNAETKVEHYLDSIKSVGTPVEEGPLVFAVAPDEVAELAEIATLDETAFDSLAVSWAATEEFSGWAEEDVKELLAELGHLAETASLQEKCLIIWQSL